MSVLNTSGRREIMRVMKLTSEAIIPTRGSSLAAGYDLSSAYDYVIPAGGKGLVKTDLVIAIPHGTYARVAPRSGLALKKFIDTGAGVIDADYRGNVGVILFNHADEEFIVKRGDRVAQLILERISYADIEIVEEMDATERGAGGFGSTGVDASLKRPRQPEDEPEIESAAVEKDVVYEAVEKLFQSGLLNDDKRKKLKNALFGANNRQYNMMNKAMANYLKQENHEQALEWVDAFLTTIN